MAIVPFLLFFTGVFNSTSVVANILVVPVVPIVMLLGLGSMLFQGSFIGDGLVDATDRLIDYVYAVATLTQKY